MISNYDFNWIITDIGSIGIMGLIIGGAISGFITNNETSMHTLRCNYWFYKQFFNIGHFFTIPFCMLLSISVGL